MNLCAKLAGMEITRRAYPSDVTDDEWAFLLPYLLLVREDAGQRQYPLRELFNALRYVVRTGCTWRYLPHDLPLGPHVTSNGPAGAMRGFSKP